MVRAFKFGPYVLIPARQTLLCHGGVVRVGGRALDLLTALVGRAGTIVSKNDLMASAWPSVTVDESNLKVNMSMLRRVLGDHHEAPAYIATIPGRGYRFVSDVERGTVENAVRPGDPHRSFRSIDDEAPTATLCLSDLLRSRPNGLAAASVKSECPNADGCASIEIIVRHADLALHFTLDKVEEMSLRS